MGGKWREAPCHQFYWIWFELIVNDKQDEYGR